MHLYVRSVNGVFPVNCVITVIEELTDREKTGHFCCIIMISSSVKIDKLFSNKNKWQFLRRFYESFCANSTQRQNYFQFLGHLMHSDALILSYW